MNIQAINEKENKKNMESVPEKIFSDLATFKETYSEIVEGIHHKETNETISELKLLLANIIKEIEMDEKLKTGDKKTLDRLKFGCLKQLSKLCILNEKIDFILDALENEPNDITLWFDLGIASYFTDKIYTSLFAFNIILKINPIHTQAMKYLILIYSIMHNFDESLELIDYLFRVTKNVCLGRILLFCIHKICPFDNLKQKICQHISRYHLKVADISLEHNDAKWFLSEYRKGSNKLKILSGATNINLVDYVSIDNLNFSTLDQLLNSVVELMALKLDFQFKRINWANNIDLIEKNSIQPQSNIILPDNIITQQKRLEKTTLININSVENVIIELNSILSEICIITTDLDKDTELKEDTTFKPSDDNSFSYYNKIFIEKVVLLIENKISYYQFVTNFIECLIENIPCHFWNLDMCSFYLHTIVNINGKFLLHRNICDNNSIMIYLRFVEIYIFILTQKNLFDNDIQKLYYISTFEVCVNKLKEYLVDSYNQSSTFITIRIFYALAFICNETSYSLSYFNICRKLLDSCEINLFCESVINFFHNCIISNKNIEKNLSNITCNDMIKKSEIYYEEKNVEKIFDIFEKNFKQNLSFLLSLPISNLFSYINLLLNSYICFDEFAYYTNNVIIILKLIINIKDKNNCNDFVDSYQETIILCLYKFMHNYVYFDSNQNKNILELMAQYLNFYYNCENSKLCLTLWNLLTKILFYVCHEREITFKQQIYLKYIENLHFYLVQKKLCCLESAKPLLYQMIIELQFLLQHTNSDCSYCTIFESYIDAIFLCLVGYPSSKKISSFLEYLKYHINVKDRNITIKNINYYKLAYDYYKPNYDCSFSILNETSMYSFKKSSMNMELFKFLSSLGNSMGEIIKNGNNQKLHQISQKYEECLHGSISWTREILQTNNYNHNFDCSLSFDFSIFHLLSDYCLKTSSYTSALRWILMALATMPFNYLSWWSCATYLIFKIEEEIQILKCHNNNTFSHQFSNLITSTHFCYQQALYFIANNNYKHLLVLLIDYSWFCYNIAYLLEMGYQFPNQTTNQPNKLYRISSFYLKYVISNKTQNNNIYYWTCFHSIFNCFIGLNTNIEERLDYVINGIKSFDNQQDFDKSNSLGIVILLFDLCLILWKEPCLSDSSTIFNLINKYISIIDNHFFKQSCNSVVTDAIENRMQKAPESISLVNSQPEFDNTCTQEDSSDTSDFQSNNIFPKDENIFGPNYLSRYTALIGMCHCLKVSSYYCKFIATITSCLFELANEQTEEYKPSFLGLIVNFLIGNIYAIVNCSSNILSRIFSILDKKSGLNINYCGLFSLSYRTNLFRKAWKLNSRFLDGLCMFQNYIYRGLIVLIEVLIMQKDISTLIHLCSNLTKERSNTFIFLQDRNKLTDICLNEIILNLEFQSNLVLSNLENKCCIININQLMIHCYKFNKLPPRIIKPYKNRISTILIKMFMRTENDVPLSNCEKDTKTLLELAIKYAAGLKSKSHIQINTNNYNLSQ
ncbi:hypothetical protein HZS_1907 [Henneguya salminicola]|nr:hypothetical protein HZS_1907 [Henneguya salminicola]